jgi:membrane protein DedA with SNARE-associated domain
MRMGLGMWVMILGILGIIVGAAMYAADYHRTIGTYGLGLGVILVIVGAAWWMMKERKAPVPAKPQPTAPAKTP